MCVARVCAHTCACPCVCLHACTCVCTHGHLRGCVGTYAPCIHECMMHVHSCMCSDVRARDQATPHRTMLLSFILVGFSFMHSMLSSPSPARELRSPSPTGHPTHPSFLPAHTLNTLQCITGAYAYTSCVVVTVAAVAARSLSNWMVAHLLSPQPAPPPLPTTTITSALLTLGAACKRGQQEHGKWQSGHGPHPPPMNMLTLATNASCPLAQHPPPLGSLQQQVGRT